MFWGDGLIDELDVNAGQDAAGGELRCELHPSFLGPYAAVHPAEDFAEAFSGFVFRLGVDATELQRKMDWFAEQPGLAVFRDRAAERNLGPLANRFEVCG